MDHRDTGFEDVRWIEVVQNHVQWCDFRLIHDQ